MKTILFSCLVLAAVAACAARPEGEQPAAAAAPAPQSVEGGKTLAGSMAMGLGPRTYASSTDYSDGSTIGHSMGAAIHGVSTSHTVSSGKRAPAPAAA